MVLQQTALRQRGLRRLITNRLEVEMLNKKKIIAAAITVAAAIASLWSGVITPDQLIDLLPKLLAVFGS